MIQGIILAAGLGSRLKEITASIPKSLIPINGQPILERNIEYMIDAGFSRIILLVGYMREKFYYLKKRYEEDIEIVLVYNPMYRGYNTLSSMYYASAYFDRDSYVVTADLYLMNNIYKKYYANHNFYLHKKVKNLDKPEWIAELNSSNCIISVNKQGYNGSSYSGISFWKTKDLAFIKGKLKKVDWSAPEANTMFWDELWFPEFKNRSIYVKHFEKNDDIYEIDDLEDLIKLKAVAGDHTVLAHMAEEQ